MKKSLVLLGACLLLIGCLSQMEYATANEAKTAAQVAKESDETTSASMQSVDIQTELLDTTEASTTKLNEEIAKQTTQETTTDTQTPSTLEQALTAEDTTNRTARGADTDNAVNAIHDYALNKTSFSLTSFPLFQTGRFLSNDLSSLAIGTAGSNENFEKKDFDYAGVTYRMTGNIELVIDSVTLNADSTDYASITKNANEYSISRKPAATTERDVNITITFHYRLSSFNLWSVVHAGPVEYEVKPLVTNFNGVITNTPDTRAVTYKIPALAPLTGLTASTSGWRPSIGENPDNYDVAQFVTAGIDSSIPLKIGNSSIYKSDLTFTVTNKASIYTDMIDTENVTVRATWNKNTNVYQEITIPIKLKWGHTLAVGGYTVATGSRLTASYSLVDDGGLKLVAGVADSDDFGVAHSSFSGQKYYSLDRFDMTAVNETSVSEETNGTDHVQANGDSYRRSAINEWGSRSVNLGDVVRVWTLEDKNYVYENEAQKSYTDGFNSVYYEIINNGFRALNLNKLSTSKQEIQYGMTHDALDAAVQSYLDTKGYSGVTVEKFVSYPDTSQPGDTTGTIQVSETLSTGKKVTYEYDVPFSVTGQLEAQTVDKYEVVLGSDPAKIDVTKLLKEVSLDGDVLTSDKYTAEITNTDLIYTDTALNRTAKITVTLKANTSCKVDVSVPIKVNWGDTLAAGGFYGQDRVSNSYSLVNEGDLKIVGTLGDSEDMGVVHSYFAGKKYATFDWFDLSQITEIEMTDDKEGTKHVDANGDEKRRDITGEWGTQVVHAGDVVRSWVAEATKNWHYIDESPVDETQGKNAVYYEVTSSGYKALQFNQLTPRTQSVGLNASTSDLDAQLSNYVDTTEYPDIEAVKFVS
ncbi:MAG: hypothetical protein ACK5NA_09750, partial [Enterococcus sp.]